MSLIALHGQLFAATSNPFPDPILKDALTVDTEVFAVIPNSAGTYPRVNQFLPSPDGTLFAIDQRGPIYQVSADGATVTAYLDLSTTSGIDLDTSSEKGFQSMAFHPDFYDESEPGYGKLYTIHSSDNRTPTPDFTPGGGNNSHDAVLLEWTTDEPSAVPFSPKLPTTPFREVMRLEQPYSNHNAGLIAFNPTADQGDDDYGKLYVAIGDGGSAGDPLDLSQNAANPYGAILRINPLESGGSAYTVPADNPFTGDPTKLDEIWAYGLRNPQRYSWDRQGRMFIADIGQGVVEEINLGQAGANYGWNEREGSYAYISTGAVGDNSTRGDASTTGYTYPIAEYDHGEGNAATAGFVYEGPDDSHLAGKFIFGDIRLGRVFYFNADALPDGGQDPVSELRLVEGGTEKSYLGMIQETNASASRADLRFGQDAEGNLYLINKQDGKVRRILPRPLTRITSVALDNTTLSLQFSGEDSLSDWQVMGSDNLQSFPDDLTGDASISETSPGQYEAAIELGSQPDKYFIRLER